MERKSHRGKSFEFDSLYSLVSNRGDSNLILDGIHENILQLNYHDVVMQKTVAFQLLSDKEKNDLAQLVSTMVSYTITYKTVKSYILPQTQRCEVADGLALSLVPPISDFINFKDYTSNHYVLSIAMKQVFVHEVRLH
ncbi:hypothetical protein JHK85_004769 [Glycine max]|nr:hypothetical protein JHK85_004769 [Glycine max]KAG5080532.1 hypothetical protein JHK86_004597 [Glycine max]